MDYNMEKQKYYNEVFKSGFNELKRKFSII